jgi:hypothetical protein
MNSHSKRLKERVFNSIYLYEQGSIDEKELMRDIEGIYGAIEEHDIQSHLNKFVIKIEESLYLYDVEEGRKFLSKEIQKLKEYLWQELWSCQ